MNELLDQVLQWPVIVQGALGSALFALFLFVAQKAAAFISQKWARYSKSARISELNIQRWKLAILLNKENDRAAFFSALVYLAVGRAVRGFIWLTLGLATTSVVPVFGLVGYAGALYYFLMALRVFKSMKRGNDPEARLEEIESELQVLMAEEET